MDLNCSLSTILGEGKVISGEEMVIHPALILIRKHQKEDSRQGKLKVKLLVSSAW